MHAETVLAVFAGYTLNGDHLDAGPLLKPFVDEALEEIEYCTGGPDTTWGKRRIADGHPEPMKVRYIEIGNEDEFDRSGSYDGRFAQFYDAIKAKYPDLQIIATNAREKSASGCDRPIITIDLPPVMANDNHHYDKTDRNGPKIFVGEWASQSGKPTPDLRAALGDAAWLMGLERNSDLVVMSCYAPLLVNVNKGAAGWGTNLIGFDAMTCYGSPSYYAQAMLAQNKGDVVLPADLSVTAAAAPAEAPHGGIGVGTWHTTSEYKDITLTDDDGKSLDADLDDHAWKTFGGDWDIHDGTLTPKEDAAPAIAMTGNFTQPNYTLSLKARKTDGKEGFLVMIRAADAHNFIWWNVGGWGNVRTGFEIERDDNRTEFGASSDQTVETGRWYDLRVEVKGQHVKAYLDNQLVNEADIPSPASQQVFASATYDKSTGEVIAKIVNMSNEPADVSVALQGAKSVASDGKAIVLTGDALNATNTINDPKKLTPHEETLNGAADSFHQTIQPRSLTVLRVRATPQ